MSSAAPEIKSPDELTETSRRALRDLILVLADSKRILGLRYSDWVLGAPELEASIAASSLSQDEWGHSRILYALLKDFGDDPQSLEHARQPSAYCNIEALDKPLASWSEFVVANAVIDTALTVQLEALADSCYAPLRQRVQKQLEEERFHAGHGAAWLRRLARASTAARDSLQQALDRHWAVALLWFGPDDFGAQQKKEGLVDASGGELRQRFSSRLTSLIQGAGLRVPPTKLDFGGWNPENRRSHQEGPDADAVARARGDRNRAFLMD